MAIALLAGMGRVAWQCRRLKWAHIADALLRYRRQSARAEIRNETNQQNGIWCDRCATAPM